MTSASRFPSNPRRKWSNRRFVRSLKCHIKVMTTAVASGWTDGPRRANFGWHDLWLLAAGGLGALIDLFMNFAEDEDIWAGSKELSPAVWVCVRGWSVDACASTRWNHAATASWHSTHCILIVGQSPPPRPLPPSPSTHQCGFEAPPFIHNEPKRWTYSRAHTQRCLVVVNSSHIIARVARHVHACLPQIRACPRWNGLTMRLGGPSFFSVTALKSFPHSLSSLLLFLWLHLQHAATTLSQLCLPPLRRTARQVYTYPICTASVLRALLLHPSTEWDELTG